MKKTALALTVLVTSCIITNCKKDKDTTPCTCSNTTSTDHSNAYHFPLTIGSYWIYESDNMDSNYVVTSVQGIDSVFINSDTTINGKQYFEKKIVNLSGSSVYILSLGYPFISRDSSGYIISPAGSFIKDDDFTDILNVKTNTAPDFTVVSRMANKDSIVTVPAGTFTTIDYFQKVTIQDAAYIGNRNKHNYDIMAPNVGDIYKTSGFYLSPTNIGIRLLRYHIAG